MAKRLFISQPMNGKTKEEILSDRKHLAIRAMDMIGEKVEVIDTFIENSPNEVNTGLWCLGKSLQLLATADVLYLEHSSASARGCRIERDAALAYGISVIEDVGEC